MKAYRFKQNPLEKQFYDLWQEINPKGRNGTLDYLLAETVNDPRGEATDRDRFVAERVIQWLGSLVGQAFLTQLGNIRKL